MALTPDQIDDFVTLTLSNFKRGKWTDLSLQHQEYISATLIDEKKVMEQGGKDINFKIQTKNTGNARNTGLFAQDVTAVEDVMISASVPWTKQTTNWSYDVDEDLFQSEKETIIREMLIREHDALNSMAELQEQNLWTAPTGSTDTRPMGIPFWIQKDATTTVGGDFNGGNPSGFTSGAAGVSTSTYPRWKNWTFGYTSISNEDLVKKLKKALAFTTFRAPNPYPELGYSKADYQIYTTYTVQEALERLAEMRNENLGSDVAKFINTVTVGGVPLQWVPYLQANDTTDPVYGVNWKAFRPYCKTGATMRRNPPMVRAGQHTVRTVHIDNWMNYICINRRLTFVGSTS